MDKHVTLLEVLPARMVQAAYQYRYKEQPDMNAQSVELLNWDADSVVGLDILRLSRMGQMLQAEIDSIIDTQPMWDVIWHQAMIYAYS